MDSLVLFVYKITMLKVHVFNNFFGADDLNDFETMNLFDFAFENISSKIKTRPILLAKEFFKLRFIHIGRSARSF